MCLLFNELRARGYILNPAPFALQVSEDKLLRDLREVSEEIIQFFSEPESFSESFVFNMPDVSQEVISQFGRHIFSTVSDKAEMDALSSAELGDNSGLAKIVLEKGYLRLKGSRALIAGELSGLPKPDGPKSTGVNENRWMAVLEIAMRTKKSWNSAQLTYCNKNDFNEETLKSSLRRAEKNQPPLKKLRCLLLK